MIGLARASVAGGRARLGDHCLPMTNLEDTSPTPAAGGLPLGRRLSLIGLAVAALLLVVLAGAAYAGYQAGLSQRQTQFQATQAADLALQYDLGVADLAAGRN